MARKYSTKINLKNRKGNLKNQSRFARKNSRRYVAGSSRFSNPLNKMSKARKEKIQKALAIVLGVFFVVGLVGFIKAMSFLQGITAELPSPDAPFGKKNEASVIYAANTLPDSDEYEQLYKVFGEENRDFIDIENVPEHVKWAFLAAEDIDFYEHPGFDVGGLIKAGMYEVFGFGSPRGGSTITQQLIKQTALTSERSYERKIKELVMSLQVERLYGKDEILEMYLNVIPFGSNVYGLKTAAKFYYNKQVSDLTIAEAAVLARIPQSPVYNSPTLAPDPEEGKAAALEGRDYVLSQMMGNLDKINDHIESDDNIIIEEEINEAYEAEMVYVEPRIDIKAPHFVFYVQQLLTNRPYNNGEPFELPEIQTGGYKIYTTLDMNMQKIAEEEVLSGVNTYAMPRGGHNGSAIVTRPDNGDILAMVGSKDYFADSEGLLFDGKVNVTNTLQSMGSSMKPAGYYKAFEMGISSPGSYLPDVPIEIGNYKPRNWNGAFKGPENGAIARNQLSESRNIPALILIDAMGVDKYVQTLTEFGYETVANNPGGYGPSLILGGGDVTMVEHAQGYGIFANGGDLVQLDPIARITKFNPDSGEDEVVYEKEPEREHVADQRAIFMVNHILNYKNGGPASDIDGRDFAGKTGTTEDTKDTIFAGYSPDMVIIGWNGNNDNTSMVAGSWGENVTKPWVTNLAKRLAPFFPEKQAFSRPGGLISGNACLDSDDDEDTVCAESGGDLLIEGRIPPAYKYKKTFRVCTDQQDKLAREIDENVGKAMDVEIMVYKMPSPALQPFLDKATESLIPTEYCDIDRSPNGNNPWAEFNSPTNGASVNDTLNLNINAYSVEGYPTRMEIFLAGTEIVDTTDIPYVGSFDVSSYEPGTYPLRVRVYDNTGLFGDSSITVKINGTNPDLSINVVPNSPIKGNPALINGNYGGSSAITSMEIVIEGAGGKQVKDISGGTYNWTPAAAGNYSLTLKAYTDQGVTLVSAVKNVTVSN